MTTIRLPREDGTLEAFAMPAPAALDTASAGTPLSRIALSAAHVVADPFADPESSALDWDATLAYRHHLWDLGLGIAEAMDTAQRGMGLDWPQARELVTRTLKEAATRPDAVVFSGVGTDHIPADETDLERVSSAYAEQLDAVQSAGGCVIVMASRALTRAAKGPDDYARVYGRLLSGMREPAILHWLGPMFDPALAGYWGRTDLREAMDVCLDIIADNAAKIDGIKISLLDKQLEVEMRRRLPEGVRMYTGDDFNYPELIEGDGEAKSDALLGIFDPIAPAASAALLALTRGDTARFRDILEPTVPLSRKIFEAPTRFYKTGVVLIAYLNGHQNHFVMVGGQQSARALPHLADVFRLAAKAGLLRDPAMATARMGRIMATYGVEA